VGVHGKRKDVLKMSGKIDLFILGVEKAGTTALFRHLAQSPLVYAHEQREMFYFLSDAEYRKGYEYACKKYFARCASELIVAKNVMQINGREAMLRLKDQSPNVKCIVMLREPAARAYSAYNYAVLRGAESSSSFEEALAREDERYAKDPSPSNPLLYLRNSTYGPRIKAAFDVYGMDRVLVVYHEDYRQDPRAQLERVERFLGKSLFDGVVLDFRAHNSAARAKSPFLARMLYRLLKSKNPIKRAVRALLSHGTAARWRHEVLDFNRIEASYKPLDGGTVQKIREKLAAEKAQLIELVGYCPWGRS
jgi:hypothetical protein